MAYYTHFWDSFFLCLPVLSVKNISKKFPGEALGAVNGLSLEIAEGEKVALVGKSGSGKTTALRMIAGLIKPDEGEIFFEGEALKDPEEQLIAGHPDIKMVFQDFQVKPNMTVFENVKYNLLHYNKEYQLDRTSELLKLCKIYDLKDKKPAELSGGQKQRLALARTLAEEPKLLLMDEPFSSLDPSTKEEILIDLLEIIKDEEIALLIVTHDASDALMIADKIGFLADGNLLQFDTPKAIYNTPLTYEIARFFGRINVFGDVYKGDKKYVRAEKTFVKRKKDARIVVNVSHRYYLGNIYLYESKDSNGRVFSFYLMEYLEKGIEIGLDFPAEAVFEIGS